MRGTDPTAAGHEAQRVTAPPSLPGQRQPRRQGDDHGREGAGQRVSREFVHFVRRDMQLASFVAAPEDAKSATRSNTEPGTRGLVVPWWGSGACAKNATVPVCGDATGGLKTPPDERRDSTGAGRSSRCWSGKDIKEPGTGVEEKIQNSIAISHHQHIIAINSIKQTDKVPTSISPTSSLLHCSSYTTRLTLPPLLRPDSHPTF